MKGIKNCGECADYDWRRRKCRICKDEGTAQDPFYADCPLPDVEKVRHGEWIPHPVGEFLSMDNDVCSNCGEQFYQITQTGCVWNYCPNCGAKMDGKESGDGKI